MAAYITIEIPPITTVATVGVRYLSCMRPNASGTALYTLIESTVRAVGRIVVWVEATAEENTMSSNRWEKIEPNQLEPNTADPCTDSTSVRWAGFASPIPVVPTPANACAAIVTSPYVASSSTVAMIPASPGSRPLSFVSSFTDSDVSQPQ